MADQPMDSRTVKWAEYVAETTLGTFPTGPTMLALPGLITEVNVKPAPVLDEYNILKGAADADPLSCGVATKAAETIEWDIKMKCTDAVGLLPHALLSSTTSTYVPGTTLLPFAIGLVAGTNYSTLTGCVITEWVLDIPDNETAAELSISGLAMAKSAWSGTDYKGIGTHATNVSAADVLTMSSLSSITYDAGTWAASDVMMESLKFGVKNEVKPVIDASSSKTSKIGNWAFGPREYILEIDGTFLDDLGLQDDVLTAAAHTVGFTIDGKAFAFSGVKWSNDGGISLNPEDKIGMSLQAAGGAITLAVT